MPVIGMPRSSALCTVQRPVPFCSAWSSTTSTNGWPVAPSTWAEHLGGDLDQEGLEVAFVPGAEDLGELRRGRAGTRPEQVVGLGDQLHVGVLDAVVHHLHEVAGAVGTDVDAARRAVDDGGDRLEHRARASGRTRAEPPGMMLGPSSAPSSPPDTPEPTKCSRCPRSCCSRRRVSRKWALPQSMTMSPSSSSGISSLITASVGSAGLDHDDDRPGAFQRGDEVLDRLRRDERALVPVLGDQALGALATCGCAAPPGSRAGPGCGPGCGPSPPAR